MRNKLFIAYRLLRSKKESRFISIVTLSSIIAISIGIAAVIIILSVMNGFESEIHQRILQLNSHITISLKESRSDIDTLIERLERIKEIKRVSIGYQLKGIIESNKKTSAVIVKSFNGDLFLQKINLTSIKRSEVIIGQELAQKMNLRIGDRLSLSIPNITAKGKVSFLNNQTFVIKKIVVYGLQDYDASLLFINEQDADEIAQANQFTKKISIDLFDIYQAKRITMMVKDIFDGKDYRISDWTEDNSVLFSAINIEKMTMTFLLFLIVVIAMFNVIVMLSMSIDAKKKEIAVLKTIGFNSLDICHIFFIQGMGNVLIGIFFGCLLGVTTLLNLDQLERILTSVFNLRLLPSGLYYIETMPYLIKINEISIICLSAIIISILSCLIPSFRAGKQDPSTITRFHNG
ncbi:MAG: FtsX-like permease family protein [Gammaproteobacteria bacterium]|nr:FtsX-like permease family protein [Gammaproteobacteria bacterium]MBT7753992.1 FtsX-like permease family protein [Gammaproteobacteria bacterium]